MKSFSVALFVVALALAATPASSQTGSGNAHVADGLALPRDHQYERYDATNATYSRVDVAQVPGLVRQGVGVYDRTDRAWVFRPQDGVNPRYASAGKSSSGVVTGAGLSLPRDRQYEKYDVTNGTYVAVGAGQVPTLIRQQVPVYDRTARAWVYRPQEGVNPAYSASARAGQDNWNRGSGDWNRGRGAGGRGDDWNRGKGDWSRTRGSVVSINGDEVILREDSGRQVTVNMRSARTRLQRGLQVGDWISVAGVAVRDDYIDARAVRERGAGSAARSGQGGQAEADDWMRIHGRVQSVQGDTMQLRADDGRTLTVDLSPVSPQIRQALERGEGVTVIGHDWTGPNRLRAEYVQQDSSDPSRGGSIAPSASPSGRR